MGVILTLGSGCGHANVKRANGQVDESTQPAPLIQAIDLAQGIQARAGLRWTVRGLFGVLYYHMKCPADEVCESGRSFFMIGEQPVARIEWGDGVRPKVGEEVYVRGKLHCIPEMKGEAPDCSLKKARLVTEKGDLMAETAIAAKVDGIRKTPHTFWNRRIRIAGTHVTSAVVKEKCRQGPGGCLMHTLMTPNGALPMQAPIPAEWGGGSDRTIEATVWLSHPTRFDTGIQLRRIRLVP